MANCPDDEEEEAHEGEFSPASAPIQGRLTRADYDNASDWDRYLKESGLDDREGKDEGEDEFLARAPAELADQQKKAWAKVMRWIEQQESQLFCLYGHAGTGKTWLARRIADSIGGKIAFVAYTGKAALALKAKGCRGAKTLHSFVYRAVKKPDETVEFRLRQPGEIEADLIILDECSMVNEELANDLLSFGRPVLAIGDPLQLPPVEGDAFLRMTNGTSF